MLQVNPMLVSAVVLTVVGLVLHIVGLATPRWSECLENDIQCLIYIDYWGLWKLCKGGYCISYIEKASFVKTSEAFSILAIFPACTALILCVLHVIKNESANEGRRLYITLAIGMLLLAEIFILVCVLVWRFAGRFQMSQMLYSFYLCVAGLVILQLACTLLIYYKRRLGRGSYHVLH